MVERGAADGAAGHRRRDVPQRQPAQAVRGRVGCRCCSAPRWCCSSSPGSAARRILVQKTRRIEVPIDALIRSLEKKPPHVVPGTAVFLTSDPDFAPASLLHNLKHNKVLHEHNVDPDDRDADTPRVHGGRARTRSRRSPIASRASRCASVSWNAERAEGARGRAQAGAAVRHHVDVVLPVAALAQAVRAVRHAGLAGPAVHRRLRARPTTPPTSSRSRPGGWWRSARRLRCERHTCIQDIEC